MTTPAAGAAQAATATVGEVNGPEDVSTDWLLIDWRQVEDDVRRLRQRIFTRGLLEPDAVGAARPVLRGRGRSNASLLPGGLGLGDPGFDASVLSEFRTRVVTHGLEERVLDLLLVALKDKGLVQAGGRQRTDSTHVVAAVRDLNRLELAGESVRACVEALAVAAPGWLAATFDVAGWGRRYGRRIDSWRLPTSQAKRARAGGGLRPGRVHAACGRVRGSCPRLAA